MLLGAFSLVVALVAVRDNRTRPPCGAAAGRFRQSRVGTSRKLAVIKFVRRALCSRQTARSQRHAVRTGSAAVVDGREESFAGSESISWNVAAIGNWSP